MVSDETRSFIRRWLTSVWALELLLLLRRHDGRAWTVAELTRELRSSETAVAEIVAKFRECGLVTVDAEGALRTDYSNRDLERIAAEIERAYAERPLALMKEIMSAPNDKIRSFADAFKLR